MREKMKIFSFKEIIGNAKEKSAFYGKLYEGLDTDRLRIEDFPLTDQKAFWDANSIRGNRLLTGLMQGGIVFKSGGTTGNPKFSVFTREEWDTFTAVFGGGISRGILRKGDRVANLFYAGELYASFLFITRSLDQSPMEVLQFPISGGTHPSRIEEFIGEYGINVIAGVPTTILSFVEYILKNSERHLSVEKILYGGESMYPDQKEFLKGVLPGVKISSIGYASVDAGLLGYADETCVDNQHRVFGSATVMEIIDRASGEVIREQGRMGDLIVTNLTRMLMPVIRYPVGDRGMWLEPPEEKDRKFDILGRTEVSARIGPMTLYIKDVRDILGYFRDRVSIINFQLCLFHRDRKDLLVIRMTSAGPLEALRDITPEIIEKIYAERPMFRELLNDNKVHPLEIEWVNEDQIITSPKTGKLIPVVDRRLER